MSINEDIKQRKVKQLKDNIVSILYNLNNETIVVDKKQLEVIYDNLNINEIEDLEQLYEELTKFERFGNDIKISINRDSFGFHNQIKNRMGTELSLSKYKNLKIIYDRTESIKNRCFFTIGIIICFIAGILYTMKI